MADPASRLLVLAAALVADAIVGDPPRLWSRLPHPVVWIGRLIGCLDLALNRDGDRQAVRRLAGAAALAVIVALAAAAGAVLHALLSRLPGGFVLEALTASVFLAQRSLHDHVAAVAAGLRDGGLAGGRRAVGMIVGRDPHALDEAGVSRAAIESLAENFSDGVVAPVFWYALAGLPGLVAYKALNTADSMIGHRTPRHRAFGWASARLDDVANFLPARLSGLLLAAAAPLAGASAAGALGAMRRDAGRHASPNAGWPEAAMAGALGLALAGPRRYGAVLVEDAWMNAGGRAEAGREDITAALRLFVRACALQLAAVMVLAAALA